MPDGTHLPEARWPPPWVAEEKIGPHTGIAFAAHLPTTQRLFRAVRRWRGGVLSEDFPALAGFWAGSLVAGYRLEAQVGAGGFAVVFRARDERLGRLVALKILAPALTADAAFRRRFIAESRAAAAVDDAHIIPVHE